MEYVSIAGMPPPISEGHGTDTRAAAHLRRTSDPAWWLAACAGTLVVLWLRDSVFSLDIRNVAFYTALFLIGALVGAFCPRRPWRWPLASFLTLAAADFCHLSTTFQIPTATWEDFLRHVGDGGPAWVLATLPVLVGAYAGAQMSQWGGS